jgi:hypothetical protein
MIRMEGNMTTEQKIRLAMNDLAPDEAKITDGCTTYHSTTRTHDSYKEQLNHARAGSSTEYFYLLRCLDWIRLLKKNNIKLHNTIK